MGADKSIGASNQYFHDFSAKLSSVYNAQVKKKDVLAPTSKQTTAEKLALLFREAATNVEARLAFTVRMLFAQKSDCSTIN
jgi:hypothetical protein